MGTEDEEEKTQDPKLNEIVSDYEQLDGFWRRYNKVQLDKLALDAEKRSLEKENEGHVVGAARPEVRHPAARLLPGDGRAHADAQTQKGGSGREVRGRAQAALQRRAKRGVVPL